MKSDRHPGAPTGLASSEGSGLLDIRSMSKTIQEATEKNKKKVDLSGLPNDFAPAALGGSVLLPVPVKRSGGGLKIAAIFAGSVIGLAGLIVGLLFAVGVLPPQDDPPPVALAQTAPPPPPPVSAPANAPAAPVEEEEKEEEPQKTAKSTKTTKNTKAAKNTKTAKNDTQTTKTETKSDSDAKKRKNTREADELLGILGK